MNNMILIVFASPMYIVLAVYLQCILLCLQFLNLFVAIIIDNFDYLVKDKSVLGAHQLSTFVKLWSIYDPSARSVEHCTNTQCVHQ